MKLSINILSLGRLDLLQECCRTVALALPAESEVLVIVDGSHPETTAWLKELRHPAFRWVETPGANVAAVRNHAIYRCEGEIIYFLDEDVAVPQHLFTQVIREFEIDPDLAIAGGPTLPSSNASPRARLLSSVLTSWFAVPKVRRRYGAGLAVNRPASQHDFLFGNLAIRPAKIPAGITFNENLLRNAESLFVYECQKQKSRAKYSPSLFVVGQRTPTWPQFAREIENFGVGRAQQTWLNPASFHPVYLFPALTLMFALTAIAATLITGQWWIIPAILLSHAALSLAGYTASTQLRALGFYGLLSIPLTAVIHARYSYGFWRGLLKSARTLSVHPVSTLKSHS